MEKLEERLKKYHLDWLALFVCVAVLINVTYHIVVKQAHMDVTDYYIHMWLATSFSTIVERGISYPIWHIGTCIVYTVMGLFNDEPSIAMACTYFTTAVNVCVYFCVWYILKHEKVIMSELTALILCFVTPVYYPKFNTNLYVGQGSPVTWHNPTNLMVKPFALLSIVIIISICNKIRQEEHVELKEYIWLAILVVLSVLAKPSYYQSIVPTLGIYIIVMLIVGKGRHFLEYVKLCLAFVPTAGLVLYQFVDAFYSTGESQGIGIKWAESAIFTNNVFISLLLVILFPLVYLILNIKKHWNSTEMHLVWINLIIAWLENMLLYEKGSRLSDGNFSWAMNLSFTILWVYVLKDFVLDLESAGKFKKVFSVKNIFLFVLLAYHIYSGILYSRMLLYIPGCWY